MVMKSPCKDCEKRFPGCHDTCEGYKKAKAEYMEATHKRWEAKRKENVVAQYAMDSAIKKLKRKMNGH